MKFCTFVFARNVTALVHTSWADLRRKPSWVCTATSVDAAGVLNCIFGPNLSSFWPWEVFRSQKLFGRHQKPFTRALEILCSGPKNSGHLDHFLVKKQIFVHFYELVEGRSLSSQTVPEWPLWTKNAYLLLKRSIVTLNGVWTWFVEVRKIARFLSFQQVNLGQRIENRIMLGFPKMPKNSSL